MAKARGTPSAAKMMSSTKRISIAIAGLSLLSLRRVFLAQRLVLGSKVGNIRSEQHGDLDDNTDRADHAAHRHDAVHILHGDFHALADLLAGNGHILEALPGKDQIHHKDDEVVDDGQPALVGRLDVIVENKLSPSIQV